MCICKTDKRYYPSTQNEVGVKVGEVERRKDGCGDGVRTQLKRQLFIQLSINISTVWVKKIPPEIFWHFFPNGWEFFVQILHASYMFLSTLDYKFLFNYLQLWRSYAILSVTTQFTSYVQNVHHRPKRALAFSDIFPKQLGIFSPNFTHLLCVPMYVRLQIFIQLSPTFTKLCHIKCDHLACVSADGGHFEHMMVVALNMA